MVIETKRKGYRFRSRLEARWSVFFDYLGIVWEYEKEGFDLGEAGKYLPDFWLPEHLSWFEVKGEHPTSDEQLKMGSLAAHTESPVVCFAGAIDKNQTGCMFFHYIGAAAPYRCLFPIYWTTCPICSRPCIQVSDRDDASETFVYCAHCYDYLANRGITIAIDRGEIKNAIDAARSARFEHGETPIVLRGRPKKT